MFTGIIREKGQVLEIKKEKDHFRLKISAKKVQKSKKIGQSIAVNGVCLSLTQKSATAFTVNVITETLNDTNIGDLQKGSTVNLEPALKLNESLDGHLVQGHVDTTTLVTKILKTPLQTEIWSKTPHKYREFIAPKGSITLNGTSLTVQKTNKENFMVALTPLTIKETNLGDLKKGDKLNLEIDLIARYLYQFTHAK